MKHPKRYLAGTVILLGTMAATHAGAEAPPTNAFAGCRLVSDGELAHMRGGFSVNTGTAQLDVAFAIERVTSINGQLQVITQLNIPSIVAAAQAQAQAAQAQAQAAVAASLSRLQILQNATGATLTISGPASAQGGSATGTNQVQVVQNGPGNNVTLPAATNPAQFVTVIQNSLDNQTIRNATVINATVTNLNLVRALAASRLITQGITNSLR